MNIYIGFDSAWAGNQPGAAAAIKEGPAGLQFVSPWVQDFTTAAGNFQLRAEGASLCVIAIDQPTIVKNPAGSRPVEQVVSPVIGRLGGGVQPANTGKGPLFGPNAPIWTFIGQLNYSQNPTIFQSQTGHYLIEVYPCLNILGLFPFFYNRKNRRYQNNDGEVARYNPRRQTFQKADWTSLCNYIKEYARAKNIAGLNTWAGNHANVTPTHNSQDQLDAVLCAIMAFEWARKCANESNVIVLGDTEDGYMVTVADDTLAKELARQARGKTAFTRFW